MNRKFLASVIAISVAFISNAQNFSGKYTIEAKEMVDGIEYLNAIAQEIEVIQSKDSIKIIRITPAGNDQTTTSTESLPLNGKEINTITSSKRTKTSIITFDKANNTATITTTFSYPEKPKEVEFKNTEIWKLNDDGTITITKTSDATVTDDWTIKAIFRKA